MIGNDWDGVLREEFSAPYFQRLEAFLDEAYRTTTVYPPREELFDAFRRTPYRSVRVVLLGQDPYHGAGQAHGLAFSVRDGVRLPPSLRNIQKELLSDLGGPPPTSGSLIPWAEQGVLLLNTVLSVEAGKAHSHARRGWEIFTDAVIRAVARAPQPIVFLLWGKPAQSKTPLIGENPDHRILAAPHPSPLSAHVGFFGSRPFSRANTFLKAHGAGEITWR